MPKQVMWPRPPKRVGDRYQYESLTFGPEAGGILLEDADPKPGQPAVQTLTLSRWKARMEALQGYTLAAQRDSHIGSPQEVKKKAQHCRVMERLIEAMIDVYRRAKQQGDLTKAEVQKYYRDHVAPVRQTHLVPDQLLPD